jgi:hypothetical protein
MDVTRGRLGFAADWLTAGALLLGTILVAALVVRELRTTPRTQTAPTETASASAVAVPAEAVSVPALMLGSGEIKVGDSMAQANARLAPAAANVTLTRQGTERGPLGPREIRWYQLSAPTGTSFIVVLEPFERRGEPRIAAIYLI